MSRDFKIVAAIADIHIGCKTVPPLELKSQLKEYFLKPLEKFPYLDAIFVLGDSLHTAVSLNSDAADVFVWLADHIYKLAKKNHCPVVWLVGTLSHDAGQIRTLKHYERNDDGVDFRIYDTIEEAILWDDYKLLILPDVKIKQLKDIDQYLNKPKKYDMILGHGMIEQLQYVQQESENMPTKTYIYDAKKLMKASKGPVLFGHVHQYQHMDEKFYYVGPFTMLERGWQDSGFAVVGIYDKDHTKFKVEHFINPASAEYYEFVITRKILAEVPVDEIIAAINELLADSKSNDLITLRITRGSELDAVDKVMVIEQYFQKDKRFSIIKKIKSKAETESEKTHEEMLKKYAYLMDESLDLPVIAYQYYQSDFKPSILDQRSPAALLTEQDFIDAFKL